MRTAAIVALAAGLAVASPARASWWPVEGDGTTTTEARQAAGFTRISSRGSLDLEVREGAPFAVSVTVDRNLQSLVRTEVEGDTLVIDTRESIRPRGKATVKVDLPALRGLELQGSGSAWVKGGGAPGELSLATSGSGDVVYAGATSALSVEANGSGSVKVAGPAADVRAELRGSGDFLYQGKARHVRLQTRGSGSVHLSGSAESLRARTSGSGDVDARDLPVRDADVSTSGSGDVWLRLVGGRLDATTSGSGDVEWWGTATPGRIESSGSGRVARRE